MAEQTLTPEAASALNRSKAMAKKRGHSHVTPLHVASTLLGFTGSILQKACISSHPHIRPLHLCFNVALNRLPTISSPPLHGCAAPLSNALSAAIKRAQAHQKRASVLDHRNPPLTPVKVDLQNLVVSILDDPSVSRVMYEAGFSSHSVKEHMNSSSARPEEEEVRWVREEVGGNTLFVGRRQGVVGEAMDEMEKEGGGRVRVIKVEFEEFGGEEVEVVLGVVRRGVEEILHGGVALMVVIYIGDLRWVVRDELCGAPVLVLEGLGRLAAEFDRTRSGFSVPLVATAEYSTYVKCRTAYPCLLFRCSFRALSIPPHCVLRIGLSHYRSHSSKSSPKIVGGTQSPKSENRPCPTSLSNSGNFLEEMETNVTLSLSTCSPSPSRTIAEPYEGVIGRLVHENLPWQVSAVPAIVKALDRKKQRNDTWVLPIHGDDSIGKRRLARVIAEAFFGSSASLLHLDLTNRRRPLTHKSAGVVVVENLDFADPHSADLLAELFEGGSGGERRIFLATTGEGSRRTDYVIRVRMEAKAKGEEEGKKKRKRCWRKIDLNKKADENEDEKLEGEVSPGSSDLTSDHTDHTDDTDHKWSGFVAEGVVLEWKEGEEEWVKEEIVKKVGVEMQGRLLDEMVLGGGSFIGGLLSKWVNEVLQSSLDSTVMARTAVRLCFDGRDVDHGLGFMGSCLPLEIHHSMC